MSILKGDERINTVAIHESGLMATGSRDEKIWYVHQCILRAWCLGRCVNVVVE